VIIIDVSTINIANEFNIIVPIASSINKVPKHITIAFMTPGLIINGIPTNYLKANRIYRLFGPAVKENKLTNPSSMLNLQI